MNGYALLLALALGAAVAYTVRAVRELQRFHHRQRVRHRLRLVRRSCNVIQFPERRVS